MIDSISFCIAAVNRTEKELGRCMAAIVRQQVPDFEIFIGGLDRPSERGVNYLSRAEWRAADPLPRSEIYNEFCKRATKRFVALLDASVELGAHWYENIKSMDCFDVSGFSLADCDGRRILDWGSRAVVGDRTLEVPLDCNEWTPRAFVNGSAMILRRAVWDAIEFDEMLGLGQGDDFYFCLRAQQEGFRVGFAPRARAVIADPAPERSAEAAARAQEAARCHYAAIALPEPEQSPSGREKGLVARVQRRLKIFAAAVRAAGLETASAQASTDKAWALYFEERYRAAERLFDRAIELDPSSHKSLRGRGWTRYKCGDQAGAVDDLNAALAALGSTDDNDARQETLRGRGWAHYHSGNLETALSDFKAALELTSQEAVAVIKELKIGCGWCLLRLGRKSASIEAFRAAAAFCSAADSQGVEEIAKALKIAAGDDPAPFGKPGLRGKLAAWIGRTTGFR